MPSILFYGNCQAYAVYQTLQLSNEFEIFNIPCWRAEQDRATFTDIVKKCDIIITQPISDNYKDVDYLSTSYLIANSKENCKILIFDSCYFEFYYFDLTYKWMNGDVLHKPIDYHYHMMVDHYTNNKSMDDYINNCVNNPELKSSEELETLATNSLEELHRRYENNKEKYTSEKVHIITTHNFIKENYKHKLLFWSMNHPTKYVIQYICEQIISILEIPNTIHYYFDGLEHDARGILYKCIQKNVHFDITQHSPKALDKSDVHEITKLYYTTYREIGFTNS